MSAGADEGRVDHWCIFRSRSRPCAVPLQWVAEVIRDLRLTRLPLGPAPLVGLCALRRDVIPVFDLAEGGAAEDRDRPEGPTSVLVLRSGSGVWGYLVDEQGIELAGAPPSAVSAGTLTWEGTSYAIVDPPASWHALRSQVLSAYRARESGRKRAGHPPRSAALEPAR
ncbi:MAG: chemotaxis protein CheW [Isosphaeraceae bacterium]|nr:chemotaxis protein CheW [Isosphaeraceae bacterium]